MTVEPAEPKFSPFNNSDWALRKAFHVSLESFGEGRLEANRTDKPTVGELFEFVLDDLRRRQSPDGPPVDRVREQIREAIAEMRSTTPAAVRLDTSIEDLFPLDGRAGQWRALQRRLPGLFLPPLEFPAGDVYFGTVFWIIVKLGLLLFGLAACCVAAPVAAIVAWLVILCLELRYAVQFPERVTTGEDLVNYVAELRYGEFSAHRNEVDEVEVWDHYQETLAAAASLPLEEIRPSRLLHEVLR